MAQITLKSAQKVILSTGIRQRETAFVGANLMRILWLIGQELTDLDPYRQKYCTFIAQFFGMPLATQR
jgi:hypothetical protein